MGFKLGKGKRPIASRGQVTKKMRFGKEGGESDVYGDNYIKYQGETFMRETINGKDMIKVDGKWKEAGDGGFPWEDDANNGNGH